MRLTVTTFLTLDGVYQAPGGPEEDPSGGFEHGGWSFPFADADQGRIIGDVFARADAFLLGRRTYDIFASFWPTVGDEEEPVASKLNSLPKYVVSTTISEPAWRGTSVIRGNVAQEVAALKARPGNELQVHGSGRLVQTLMADGLVDEFRLLIYPVVLGTGRRLFERPGQAAGLRLVDCTTTSTGVVVATYAPDGPVRHGSFAGEQGQP